MTFGFFLADQDATIQAHPNMSGHRISIDSDAIFEMRRNSSEPQHPVNCQALVKANGSPGQPAGRPPHRNYNRFRASLIRSPIDAAT
jgi:hypothetical protein